MNSLEKTNKDKIVIGVVGLIGSGKGTFGDYLVKHHNFRSLSFAAPLKDAVSSIFGWSRDLLEGASTESRLWREQTDVYWSQKLNRQITPRKVLQEMGTEVMRNNFDQNIWIHSMEKHINNSDKNIVITDVRFSNEMNMIKNVNGTVVWIKKDPLPEWFDIAVAANNGSQNALNYMKQLTDVHESEWAWVGSKIDLTITNNDDINSFYQKIDDCVQIWS